MISLRYRTVQSINNKPLAYLVWGIEDETHEIVGTAFSLHGDPFLRREAAHRYTEQLMLVHAIRSPLAVS